MIRAIITTGANVVEDVKKLFVCEVCHGTAVTPWLMLCDCTKEV